MKKIESNFIVIVLVANLFAIVFYGGRYLLNGHIYTPHEEQLVLVKPENSISLIGNAHADEVEAAPIVADASKGKKVAGKCKACHSLKANGKHKVGPMLWGIVGKSIAEQDGFSYSKAFNKKKGEVVWDEAALDVFLKKPKKFIKGTKMAFGGVRKEQDRADLIAWLKNLK